jgi:preprotein translocase subunit SecF
VELLGGRKTHIDFIGKRKIAFTFSAILSMLGLAAFAAIALGQANLGIEFVGGVAVQVDFEKPVGLAEAREALDQAGFPAADLQSFEGGSKLLVRVKGSDVPLGEIADRVIAALRARFAGNSLTVDSASAIGPTVGRALQKDALIAIAISLVAIVIYIAVRFQFRFGVAATIATLHDVLAVLGIFWLLGREINLLLVVALLTLAGYSLSDTVVVFDRIRETLARAARRPLGEVINMSINDVLSRTMVTGLTTLLASISLFVWGGEVLRDFSLALTIGIVIGTYSSIFVASPILFVWGLPGVRPAPAPGPAARAAEAGARAAAREGMQGR